MRKKKQMSNGAFYTLSILLILILLFYIGCSLTIAGKAILYPERVADIFGHAPVVIGNNDLYPQYERGDFVLADTKNRTPEKGDVIFAKYYGLLLAETVADVEMTANGTALYHTTLNSGQREWVFTRTESDILALPVCKSHAVGSILLFSRTIGGVFVCYGIPLILMIAYIFFFADWIEKRRNMREKSAST